MKKSLKVVAMSSAGLAFALLLIVMGVYLGDPPHYKALSTHDCAPDQLERARVEADQCSKDEPHITSRCFAAAIENQCTPKARPECQQYQLCYLHYKGEIERAEVYFDQPCWSVKNNQSRYKSCPKPELPK